MNPGGEGVALRYLLKKSEGRPCRGDGGVLWESSRGQGQDLRALVLGGRGPSWTLDKRTRSLLLLSSCCHRIGCQLCRHLRGQGGTTDGGLACVGGLLRGQGRGRSGTAGAVAGYQGPDRQRSRSGVPRRQAWVDGQKKTKRPRFEPHSSRPVNTAVLNMYLEGGPGGLLVCHAEQPEVKELLPSSAAEADSAGSTAGRAEEWTSA